MDRKWINIGFLSESNSDFSKYNKDIGVYRAILDAKTVYIGKATELNNGGFRKRLRDYTRISDSARNYPSGKKMHENKDDIIIEILIVERNSEGKEKAERLEKEFIIKCKPVWNELDSKG